MRVTVLGCSGSFTGPDSPASGYLVQVEHMGRTWSLVLDLGNGSLGPLQRHVALDAVDALVVSHLHPDHCADLCGYYVVRTYHPGGPMSRLAVHAPAGADARMGRMYSAQEPPDSLADRFDFHDLQDARPFRVGPFTVTAHRMAHPVEAYGVRVEHAGKVLAYTGDTDSCPALTPLLTGADLALMDCAYVDGRDEIVGVHLSGSRAAAAAVEAGGVQRLVLTHLPAWNDPRVCRQQAAAVWPGEVEIARAGTQYEL